MKAEQARKNYKVFKEWLQKGIDEGIIDESMRFHIREIIKEQIRITLRSESNNIKNIIDSMKDDISREYREALTIKIMRQL